MDNFSSASRQAINHPPEQLKRDGAIIGQPACNQILDRNTSGQFVAGNRCSVGHSGRAKNNLLKFRACFRDSDIEELAVMLLDRAKQGDLSAVKLILTYLLPMPSTLLKIEENMEREARERRQREAILNPTHCL